MKITINIITPFGVIKRIKRELARLEQDSLKDQERASAAAANGDFERYDTYARGMIANGTIANWLKYVLTGEWP